MKIYLFWEGIVDLFVLKKCEVLRIAWNIETFDWKMFNFCCCPPDICTKVSLASLGGRAEGQHAQTQEGGPPIDAIGYFWNSTIKCHVMVFKPILVFSFGFDQAEQYVISEFQKPWKAIIQQTLLTLFPFYFDFLWLMRFTQKFAKLKSCPRKHFVIMKCWIFKTPSLNYGPQSIDLLALFL
jgi:hypothetical protein